MDGRRPTRHPALMTTPTSRGELGDEIRRRRKAARMTQTDLAKLAAVATTNVGKIERGDHVSVTTMRAVARALDLPAELTAPFLSESPAGDSPELSGLTPEQRRITRYLHKVKGWPPERIADFLDELERSSADPPPVEPRPASDQ